MGILGRLRFSAKLTLLTGTALGGLVLFAVIAFYTVRVVRINSPLYQNIALAYQLAGDCYDPPASLVDALPPALAAEEATTPEETQRYVALLQGTDKVFEDSHKHYQRVLPPGAIRDLMRDASYPTGHQWLAIAEQEFIPALLKGDHVLAHKIRVEKMNPVFVRHKEANDRLAELTASWIPGQELAAARIIRVRSVELGILFFVITALVSFLGYAISRGIVQPVRQTVDVLTAMSNGDLSQTLSVQSSDEMGAVAESLNQTITAFRHVLSSIRDASGQAAAASAELTADAQETAQRSAQQAMEAQQVAAAMAEMVASIGEVSQAAHVAEEAAESTESAASRGSLVVQETQAVLENSVRMTNEEIGRAHV